MSRPGATPAIRGFIASLASPDWLDTACLLSTPLLIAILLLSGCQSQPTLTVARTVDVPIRGACISAADIPAVPTPANTRQEDEKQGVAALIVEVLEWADYGRITDALMRGCAK